MINDDFIQLINQAIKEDSERVALGIVGGSCPTYDEYKSKSGYIKGQKRALEIIKDEYAKYIAK